MKASPDSLTSTRRKGFDTGDLSLVSLGNGRATRAALGRSALAFAVRLLLHAGLRRDLRREIRSVLLLDALAEREADEAGELDRRADLRLGLLQHLPDGLRGLVHVALLE